MKVGIVCPYAWDVPGGVQAHVEDLARRLLGLGHDVSVLAPVDDPDGPAPPWLVPAGRTVPVPYNGSLARLCFGPLSLARTRRWLKTGAFDVLHVHEPTVPSVSMLAMWSATGPMVATFHTATERSRALMVFQGLLRPGLEKFTGRIAVSPAARRVIMEHLGGDAVLVPNGVDVARFWGAAALDDDPRPTVVFLGRLDEPRKGLAVLLAALPQLRARVPEVRVLVGGPGTPPPLPQDLAGSVVLLGQVAERDKPGLYATATAYCAPNTHGESFGIVLLEAMAAGAPVVASDLDAFRAVLRDGQAGVLVPAGDPAALAGALADLIGDPARRAALRRHGQRVAASYDWDVVVRQVVAVYRAAAAAAPVTLDEAALAEDLASEDGVGGGLRRWLAGVRG